MRYAQAEVSLVAKILGSVTTTYHVRNQLTGDSLHTYGYDPAGNRNNSGQTIGTGNRLQLDTHWGYTYDDEGNLTQKVSASGPTVTWTYAYDVKNRMTSARESGGGNELYAVTYSYDVFNNRIQEQEDADGAGAGAAVTIRFAVEGMKVHQNAWSERQVFVGMENWDVWADLDGSNNLKVRYERGDVVDELFSRIKSDGTVAWYLTDRMQSVRQIVDAAGVVRDTVGYDGFGNVTSESSPGFGDRWKWTAREYGATTQLLYNRARNLSVFSGKWLSEDMIRYLADDYNLSRYLSNSTPLCIDPSGLQEDRATRAIRREIADRDNQRRRQLDPRNYPYGVPPTPPILVDLPKQPTTGTVTIGGSFGLWSVTLEYNRKSGQAYPVFGVGLSPLAR